MADFMLELGSRIVITDTCILEVVMSETAI